MTTDTTLSRSPSRARRPSHRCRSVPVLLLAALLALPGGLGAQGIGELLGALQQGGGWIGIPVAEGRGSLETAALPTAGLELSGCARVWSGHSGTFRIRAEDVVTERVLDATLGPGESVRFRHATGPRARLRVDVRWSEPRDTTLLMWVGLERRRGPERAACEPAER